MLFMVGAGRISFAPPALHPALCTRGPACLDQGNGLWWGLTSGDPGRRSESRRRQVLGTSPHLFPCKVASGWLCPLTKDHYFSLDSLLYVTLSLPVLVNSLPPSLPDYGANCTAAACPSFLHFLTATLAFVIKPSQRILIWICHLFLIV